ncbi:pectin lyase fold/virulence factor [Fusarium redolens]|uniref:pectin lyase n=1 Tax=Fusarium redolens TaxID=48865 RepID=A0A9P9KYL6_FUSRE|nr:pectin lyase fold/virulence factor [Fusarium redolens]KAH7270740.1 pectin lyase fold/virulence factor [Fusarium redolens]
MPSLFKTLFAVAAALPSALGALPTRAEGFGSSTTGGGSAAAVYPKSAAELVSYLGDSSPRVIYLDRTINFIGTEGTASETGCAPWGTGSKCQTAINQNNWCGNYQPNAPKVNVKYDKAGILGIKVGSNKSLIGVGSKGVIRGKGLRIVGSKNVIIQNVHITELNPQYVWGGDAITLDNTDNVWIDHVTTSLIGRQHIVLGNNACNRVTISNSKIDGTTSWSASCNNYHYWGLYFAGSNDLVTFKNNYVYRVSGRGPKVSGNTLLHAVNNFFHDVPDHAFEIDSGSVLAEGNIFQNVKFPVDSKGYQGQLFGVPTSGSPCAAALGRNCQLNGFGSSGTLGGTNTGFLNNFKGKTIASASDYNSAKSVMTSAGFGMA